MCSPPIFISSEVEILITGAVFDSDVTLDPDDTDGQRTSLVPGDGAFHTDIDIDRNEFLSGGWILNSRDNPSLSTRFLRALSWFKRNKMLCEIFHQRYIQQCFVKMNIVKVFPNNKTKWHD